MKHYLRIYLLLVKLNFSVLTGYRGSFVSSLVSSFTWGLFSFISTFLLTSRSPSIFGWTREMFFAMTATYAIFIGIFHGCFSTNFGRLATIIHLGQLDPYLLKPIDAQFFVSVRYISFVHISRVVMGIVVLAYLFSRHFIQVSFLDVMVYFLLIGISLVLLYSIWLLVLTTTIWFTRLSNLVEVMYTVSSIGGRMPKAAFEAVGIVLATILLPLILIINTPTEQILKRPFGIDIIWLILLTIIFFVSARKFWQFALRHYCSASS